MNLINQRKAGVVLSYVSEGIQILTGLLYTPVMLRILGQSEYGLYQLVYSTISYMSLFSLGFSGSYMRFYSRFKAENEEKEIFRLNGIFIIIFLIMSGISIICGGVLICNFKEVMGNGLTNAEIRKAQVLMAFMVFNMAISFPNSVFICNTTAHERFIFQKSLIVLQKILNPFLVLLLLMLGYGSVGMVLVTTLLAIVTLICNVVFCFKKLHIKFWFNGFHISLLKEMWEFTFFIFLNQIIDQINWNLDKFLLGRMIGTTAVAVYGLGAQINMMYVQFSGSISNVFVPKVNQIVMETNDNKELSFLFVKIGRIQFIVLALIWTGFVIFGKPFMQFWAGTGYEESYDIALWLITPVTIPLIQNLGIEIQRAKNMHKARSVVYFCVVIINIGISIYFIGRYGVSGAAIGTAISLTLGTIIFMNWYYHFCLGLDMLYFWRSILKFVPSLIIPIMVGIVIRFFIPVDSFIVLLVCIFLYCIVYMFFIWNIGMNNTEKNIIKNILKKD